MEFTEIAPREYAEWRLACLTGWDIDKVSTQRVDEALHFMSLEAKYRKKKS